MTASPGEIGAGDGSLEPGVVYMLHFLRPHKHAQHYVGWTSDLPARIAAHSSGQGARLVEVFRDEGIGFVVARTVRGDRRLERAIKNAGGSVRYCPLCSTRPLNGKWSGRPLAGSQGTGGDSPPAEAAAPGERLAALSGGSVPAGTLIKPKIPIRCDVPAALPALTGTAVGTPPPRAGPPGSGAGIMIRDIPERAPR